MIYDNSLYTNSIKNKKTLLSVVSHSFSLPTWWQIQPQCFRILYFLLLCNRLDTGVWYPTGMCDWKEKMFGCCFYWNYSVSATCSTIILPVMHPLSYGVMCPHPLPLLSLPPSRPTTTTHIQLLVSLPTSCIVSNILNQLEAWTDCNS